MTKSKNAKMAKKMAKKPVSVQKPVPKTSNSNTVTRSAYFRAIADPFNAFPAHIPDPDVSPSGLITTRYHYRNALSATSGTSTVHAGGWVMFPYPVNCFNSLTEPISGGGSVTDLANATGTVAYGTITAPNLATFWSTAGKIRCVGMAMRVYYEGTELNRAGRFIGGLLPIVGQGAGVASTGTVVSLLSCLTGSGATTVSVSYIRDSLTEGMEVRFPSEKVVEYVWKPSRVPAFQRYNNNNQPNRTASGATTIDPCVFSAAPGGNGSEQDQNALVVVFEGDTVPAASAQSNVFAVDCIWHWEVAPDEVTAISYGISPSPSHSSELDAVMNTLAQIPVGRVINYGSESTTGVGQTFGSTSFGVPGASDRGGSFFSKSRMASRR